MASQQVMTEDDGDDDDVGVTTGNRAPAEDLPEGLANRISGGNFDLSALDDNNNAPPSYQIIDSDDDLQPLEQRNDPQYDDDRLNQDDGAGAPLIEAGRGDVDGDGQRRPSRAEKRRAQRNGRDRTLAELNMLRAQVEELKGQVGGIAPRLSEFDVQNHQRTADNLARQIDEAAGTAANAYREMFAAFQAGEEEKAAKAMESRDRAIMRGQQLTVQRNTLISGNPFSDQPPADGRLPMVNQGQQPQQRQQVQQQQPQANLPPPAVIANIRQFATEFPWFNPDDRTSAASQAVAAIDRQVAAEGYDPAGPDYWDELRDRMREELPPRIFNGGREVASNNTRAGNGNGGRQVSAPNRNQQIQQPARTQPQPQRRGPVVAGASDRGPGNGRAPQRVHLNEGRKAAMIETGALAPDGRTVVNASKFERQLEQFRRYDAENGVTRQ